MCDTIYKYNKVYLHVIKNTKTVFSIYVISMHSKFTHENSTYLFELFYFILQLEI